MARNSVLHQGIRSYQRTGSATTVHTRPFRSTRKGWPAVVNCTSTASMHLNLGLSGDTSKAIVRVGVYRPRAEGLKGKTKGAG